MAEITKLVDKLKRPELYSDYMIVDNKLTLVKNLRDRKYLTDIPSEDHNPSKKKSTLTQQEYFDALKTNWQHRGEIFDCYERSQNLGIYANGKEKAEYGFKGKMPKFETAWKAYEKLDIYRDIDPNSGESASVEKNLAVYKSDLEARIRKAKGNIKLGKRARVSNMIYDIEEPDAAKNYDDLCAETASNMDNDLRKNPMETNPRWWDWFMPTPVGGSMLPTKILVPKDFKTGSSAQQSEYSMYPQFEDEAHGQSSHSVYHDHHSDYSYDSHLYSPDQGYASNNHYQLHGNEHDLDYMLAAVFMVPLIIGVVCICYGIICLFGLIGGYSLSQIFNKNKEIPRSRKYKSISNHSDENEVENEVENEKGNLL